MAAPEFIPRQISQGLLQVASQYPVLTLTGPRQSGKTTLCRKLFGDFAYRNLEDPQTRTWAQEDPRAFLTDASSMVIDEFQRVPELASLIQILVDEPGSQARFVLTGSQQLEISQAVRQSLAGRTVVAKLLPLSMRELAPFSLDSTDELLFKGFYPRIHHKSLEVTLALSSYVQTYLERDVRQLTAVQNQRTFTKFLRLCAVNVGQSFNASRMSNDLGVDSKTVRAWLSVLEASFVVFLLPPHFANLRKRVIKSPKLYFYDVGLAAHLLGAQSSEDLARMPNRGALFENLIIAEALKQRFNALKSNNLYYYRDQGGHEVDLLLDGGPSIHAVEIKSGTTFQREWLKGLEYYRNLNPAVNSATLVYGGQSAMTVQDTQVLPYTEFCVDS